MAARAWDRFMVHTKIGANRKLRRLTVAERWCFVAGVLAMAAESPVRGVLLIAGRTPATEEDYAEMAGVPKTVATSTMRKLRELEMVERDEETGFEVVHDWEDWQREPAKDDPTAADRMRRYRDKLRNGSPNNRNADRKGYGVTEAVTLHEGEEEGEEQKNSTVGPRPDDVRQVFDEWVGITGRTGATVLSDKRRRLIRQALDSYPLDDVLDAVRGWRRSPHHRGENERRTIYNDLELLLRDAQQIEKFRDLERSAPTTLSPRPDASPVHDDTAERLKAAME